MRRESLFATLVLSAALLSQAPALAEHTVSFGAGEDCNSKERTVTVGQPLTIEICTEVQGDPLPSHELRLEVTGPAEVRPQIVTTDDAGLAQAKLIAQSPGRIVVKACDNEGCSNGAVRLTASAGAGGDDTGETGVAAERSPAAAPVRLPEPADLGWLWLLLIGVGVLVGGYGGYLLVRPAPAGAGVAGFPARPERKTASRKVPRPEPDRERRSSFLFEQDPLERKPAAKSEAKTEVLPPPLPTAPAPPPPVSVSTEEKPPEDKDEAKPAAAPEKLSCAALRARVFDARATLAAARRAESEARDRVKRVREKSRTSHAGEGEGSGATRAFDEFVDYVSGLLDKAETRRGEAETALAEAEKRLLEECGETLPPEGSAPPDAAGETKG